MSLTGNAGGIPIEIRESPTLDSNGQTRVREGGNGSYNIDSFFDISLEISVNGGPFMPQVNGTTHMELTGGNEVPSLGPLGLVMLTAALGLSGALTWRRRASKKG
jgi:hypothetical protein